MKLTAAALLVCLALAPALAADPPKGPDLGKFDYKKVIDEHAKLVAGGKAKEAADYLDKLSPTGAPLDREAHAALLKKFDLIAKTGGKVVGHELVGYKRLSSRLYRLYAVSHYEKLIITYSYLFNLDIAGNWNMIHIGLFEGVDELEKVTPLTPLAEK